MGFRRSLITMLELELAGVCLIRFMGGLVVKVSFDAVCLLLFR